MLQNSSPEAPWIPCTGILVPPRWSLLCMMREWRLCLMHVRCPGRRTAVCGLGGLVVLLAVDVVLLAC